MKASSLVPKALSAAFPEAHPLTVLILFPVENQKVSGVGEVEVVILGSPEAHRVELFVDGVLWDTAMGRPFTFIWDTSRHTNGEHLLEAVAYDGTGNKGVDTTSVTVRNPVVDDAPPSPVITSPISGETVMGVVNVWVYSTDDVNMQRVELYVNDLLYQFTDCEGTECNVQFDWNTKETGKGSSALRAVAFDSAGNRGESEKVFALVA
jgi:hypothetical protein